MPGGTPIVSNLRIEINHDIWPWRAGRDETNLMKFRARIPLAGAAQQQSQAGIYETRITAGTAAAGRSRWRGSSDTHAAYLYLYNASPVLIRHPPFSHIRYIKQGPVVRTGNRAHINWPGYGLAHNVRRDTSALVKSFFFYAERVFIAPRSWSAY